MTARPLLGALSLLFTVVAFMAGCTVAPSVTQIPTLTPAMPEPATLRGITVVDPRLRPAMLALAQHPDRAPGSTTDLNAHLARASFPDLCVEVLRPNLLPLYLTVDVASAPWALKSIVVFDPATDDEPRITYDSGDPDSQPDLCRHVLLGSSEPFPGEPASVEVNGGIQDPAHPRLLAQAIVAQPDWFGLDRSSRPAINLSPLPSSIEGRACYDATVFQGGPRAVLKITFVGGAAGWRLHHVRITRQALHTPGPVPDGTC